MFSWKTSVSSEEKLVCPQEKQIHPGDDEHTRWGRHSPGGEGKAAHPPGKWTYQGEKNLIYPEMKNYHTCREKKHDTGGSDIPAMMGTCSFACKGFCWTSPCLGGTGLVGVMAEGLGVWRAGGDVRVGSGQASPWAPRFTSCACLSQTLGGKKGGCSRCIPEKRKIGVKSSFWIR